MIQVLSAPWVPLDSYWIKMSAAGIFPRAVGRDSATLCREKSRRTPKTDCLIDASILPWAFSAYPLSPRISVR
jgi:hypothetical protein